MLRRVAMRSSPLAALLLMNAAGSCSSLPRIRISQHAQRTAARVGLLIGSEGIVSPFETDGATSPASLQGPLPLTLENVELVLDEMRPYLLADGGNVAVREIDGATVVLELQGACGTCPSSSMTMKLGLERGLLCASRRCLHTPAQVPLSARCCRRATWR